jgi:hypothetical protein
MNVLIDTGILVGFLADFTIFGISFDSGFLIGVSVTDSITIITGLTIPIAASFASGEAGITFALHTYFGLEIGLTENINFFLKGVIGPAFIPGSWSLVMFSGEGMAGIQWHL